MYELAAERGDERIFEETRRDLSMPNRCPSSFASASQAGSPTSCGSRGAGDFTACRNVLTVLKDTPAEPTANVRCAARSSRSSRRARDDDTARRLAAKRSRRRRDPSRAPAHELRYRRLARALAAVAGELVGDIVRGRRAAEARFLQDDADIASLVKLPPEPSSRRAETIRGYARFVVAGAAAPRAGDRRAARPPRGDRDLRPSRPAATPRRLRRCWTAARTPFGRTCATLARARGSAAESRSLARARQLGIAVKSVDFSRASAEHLPNSRLAALAAVARGMVWWTSLPLHPTEVPAVLYSLVLFAVIVATVPPVCG